MAASAGYDGLQRPNGQLCLIDKLLAKAREDRFQSGDEVAGLLERCLAHVQHPTSLTLPDAVTALAARHRPTRRAHRLAMWPIPVVAALIGFVGWSVWQRPPVHEEGLSGGRSVVPAVVVTSTRPSTPRTLPKELTRWNDGVEPAITEIEAKFRRLERNTNQPW